MGEIGKENNLGSIQLLNVEPNKQIQPFTHIVKNWERLKKKKKQTKIRVETFYRHIHACERKRERERVRNGSGKSADELCDRLSSCQLCIGELRV